MPYNPSQNYIGGQLLASGIGDMGKGIAGGISAAFTEAQKAKEEQSANQVIIDYAVKNNLITPEQHTQYLNGSSSAKNGVVAGLTRTLAMDMQRKQEARLAQNADLQQRQGEEELKWYPRKAAASSSYDTARAASELADTGPGGSVGKVDAQPLILNNKPVPGLAIVSRPGTKQFQVITTGEAGVRIQTPEGTKQQFYLDAKGNPHPIKEGDPIAEQIAKMMGGETNAEGGMRNAESKPAPAAAPRQLSAMDAQALSWARSNPDDPRAAAILKRLGM